MSDCLRENAVQCVERKAKGKVGRFGPFGQHLLSKPDELKRTFSAELPMKMSKACHVRKAEEHTEQLQA